MSLMAEALKSYNYQPGKPLYQVDKMAVFEAVHK